MGKLIIAPNYEDYNGKIVFLAGPITGADRWQDKAISIIQKIYPELNIANPRRPISTDGRDFSDYMFAEQVDWESYYLKEAAKNGAVLFYLAKEAKHYCDRSYAQTTRFELGEWTTKHKLNGVKLVLGIEEGFSGDAYIKRRLNQDSPDTIIKNSLEDTCYELIRVLNH